MEPLLQPPRVVAGASAAAGAAAGFDVEVDGMLGTVS